MSVDGNRKNFTTVITKIPMHQFTKEYNRKTIGSVKFELEIYRKGIDVKCELNFKCRKKLPRKM